MASRCNRGAPSPCPRSAPTAFFSRSDPTTLISGAPLAPARRLCLAPQARGLSSGGLSWLTLERFRSIAFRRGHHGFPIMGLLVAPGAEAAPVGPQEHVGVGGHLMVLEAGIAARSGAHEASGSVKIGSGHLGWQYLPHARAKDTDKRVRQGGQGPNTGKLRMYELPMSATRCHRLPKHDALQPPERNGIVGRRPGKRPRRCRAHFSASDQRTCAPSACTQEIQLLAWR